MARVAARVTDKRVLKLIRAFLKSGVMEDGLGVVAPGPGQSPIGYFKGTTVPVSPVGYTWFDAMASYLSFL
jgi:hypothetical protein